MNTTLSENTKFNTKAFILDPMTVIIKLIIIANKPVGTKIRIANNTILFDEPGIFQSIMRYITNTTKSEIHYLINPIYVACTTFLTKDKLEKYPNIANLFNCAKLGLKKLVSTYKSCSVIVQCINYQYAIIDNFVSGRKCNLFITDDMTSYYTTDTISKLNGQWDDNKLKMMMTTIAFIDLEKSNEKTNDNPDSDILKTYIKSIENLLLNMEKSTFKTINAL